MHVERNVEGRTTETVVSALTLDGKLQFNSQFKEPH